ncbi:MAG: hypothetical protein J0L50_07765 [Sphingomonadales bacterium]|nr:hypothetical protein [Sphingomonadales bacterium]
MDNAQPKFDWIAWLASVPGIPAGWGETPAQAATVVDLPVRAEDADLPELKAA